MALIYRQHALRRMFERRISHGEVEEAMRDAVCIERYPADTPYPSGLWLGQAAGRALHVVAADLEAGGDRVIITVYEPDPQLWEPGFRHRRKP